ncbi:hypothetical protein [Xanthomonas sp. NCPPB 2632]|uniref:hypothetical protein n=1 Tax=Xanthomonas sp. NCPPB 2632 TaxID=3240912 RepID=UPI0035198553
MFAELLKMADLFKTGSARMSASVEKAVEPTMTEKEAMKHGLFFEPAVTAADVDEAEGPHEEH